MMSCDIRTHQLLYHLLLYTASLKVILRVLGVVTPIEAFPRLLMSGPCLAGMSDGDVL